MECECKNWARTDGWLTEHHPGCEKYDLKGDAINIITALIRGIESWASDEDGVHDDCWEAYQKAKFCIGEKLQTDSWKDKDGNQRSATRVILSEMQMLGGGGKKEEKQEEPQPKEDDPEIPF